MTRRASCDGDKGTVRFEGELPDRPGKQWVGIEWDNPERGTHFGSLNGVSYFTCDSNKASFVRSKRVVKGKTLVDIVQDRYDGKIPTTMILLGEALEQLVTHNSTVYENLECLDISDTLVSDMKDIANFSEFSPNLKELLMSSIYIRSFTSVGFSNYSKVEFLAIDRINCLDKFLDVLPQMVSLKKLHLRGNNITTTSSLKVLSLEELDLSNNRISNWSEISNLLTEIPDLKKLLLCYNQLDTILPSDAIFSLEELNISGNPFTSLDSLHVLKSPSFKNLFKLGFQWTPLASLKGDVVLRSELLVMLPKLRTLNLSNVTDIERADAVLERSHILTSGNASIQLSKEDSRIKKNALSSKVISMH